MAPAGGAGAAASRGASVIRRSASRAAHSRAPLGATFDTIVALGCGRERLVVSTARARV